KVGLADAEQVDPLATGDFDHLDLVSIRDIRDAPQLVGRRDTAVHAGDDGEAAVLLDVRVDAIVDEPRAAFFLMLVELDLRDEVGDARLAGAAAPAGAALRCDR